LAGYNFLEVREKLDQGNYYGDVRHTGWHSDAVYEKFSEAEFERRYNLTRAAMAEHGLDCIIVPGSIHAMSMGHGLVWLTGHLDIRTAAHYVVVPLEGEPTLFCSMGGSHVEAVRQAVSISDVRPGPGNKFGEIIAAHLKEIGLEKKRIGLMNAMSERFGEEYMPANHYLALKEALPEAELVFVTEFFHELMYLHSEEEIEFIRQAGELCDQALQAIIERAKPGVTESQLAASAAKAIMDGGGIPHLLIIAITSTAEPCAVFGNPRPSGRVLKEGDIILNEVGAWYQGTSAQSGNPIVCGRPSQFVNDFFQEVVVPGFNLMAEQLQPGQTLDDVYRAGGMYFREKGHQSRPLHIHCIDIVSAGPEVRVNGPVHKGYDNLLQPGMEIMLEPCPITADGNLGMFLGRTCIITEAGHEWVTKLPVELYTV
jgi:Xaa-Pro aminopeptidase